MICRNCGREIVGGVRFCGGCGAEVLREDGEKKVVETKKEETSVEGGWQKTCAVLKKGWKSFYGFFNIRKLTVFIGLFLFLQVILMFCPVATYTEISYGEIERVNLPLWAAFAGSGGGAIVAVIFLVMIPSFIMAIVCVCAKKNRKIGNFKKTMLFLFVAANLLVAFLGAVTFRSKIDALVETTAFGVTSKMTVFGPIAIIVALCQVGFLIMVFTKSKANNIQVQNSPEYRLAKYKKMVEDGLMTKEEFDAKMKETLRLR